jgi:pimeloyl-ACP methyl ester carboxylesterase
MGLTITSTRFGPSELTVTGTLKDWVGWTNAHLINVETLLINGRYDEVQDIAVAPWFKKIPRVKWMVLDQSAHIHHFEERHRCIGAVASFLGS